MSFKTADAKEHKKNNIHIIKNDLIKHIRELDATDEEDKKIINRLSKSLNVKYVKDKQNINQLE